MDNIQMPSGTWKVVKRIGDKSGMGQVFEARCGEETSAIKVIDEVGKQIRDELANEVPESKYVVPIIESHSSGGKTFFRMPLAEYSLEGFRDKQPGQKLTLEQTIGALRDIATGLTEIDAQVTHRDIKPDNVLWHNNRWCLTDFGLARIADSATAVVTMKGWATIQYVAPEILTGARASGKSDIYALGVTAYRLLTGEYPFSGEGVVSDEEIRQWHQSGKIPPPNSGSSQLDSLIIRTLMKAPEARPTARTVRDRLSTIEEGPKFGAVEKLHELAAEQDLARADAGRQISEQTTRKENRQRLVGSGKALADMFMSNLKESLESVSGIHKEERMGEIYYRFGQGTLIISPIQSIDEIPSMPFDVVASFSMTIEQVKDNMNWNGRQHSLWFCDAEEKESYDWYETAFHRIRGQRPRLEPYALIPLDGDAQMAFSPVIHTVQIARKLIRVSDEQADEFINRWLTYIGEATNGQLAYPLMLPEGERAVWRRS